MATTSNNPFGQTHTHPKRKPSVLEFTLCYVFHTSFKGDLENVTQHTVGIIYYDLFSAGALQAASQAPIASHPMPHGI